MNMKDTTLEIIADFAENFEEFSDSKNSFNDHMYKSEINDILNAIRKAGYKCNYYGGVEKLIESYSVKESIKNKYFINLSDGLSQSYSRLQVPILCELIGVKYSGSSPFSVALMNNKHYSKLAVQEIGIDCPKGILITNKDDIKDISKFLNFPIIIKPNTGGSSDGIDKNSVQYDINGFENKSKEILNKGYEVLVEEYIPGYEVTTLIIGNKNDIRINETIVYEFGNKLIHEDDVMDANLKANNLRKAYYASDIFTNDFCNIIKSTSEKIFIHLNACDIARIDYRITPNHEIKFIEINSQPSINKESEGGFICEKLNISFDELYSEYIQTFLNRININHD